MTFEPARPRYRLPFDGREYDLLGDLALVEAVEYAFQDGIVRVAARVPDMSLTDTARLLATVFTACGHKATAKEVGETIFNTLGINSEAFQLLRLHAYAFLKIILQPPELREKTATQMGELLGEATRLRPSPGGRTRKSA